MENLVHLELSDKTKISIYPTQQIVVFGDTALKFEELKAINKAIRECKTGKKAGRSLRPMPKSFAMLCDNGLSYAELAKVYNCSKTTVCRWKREIKKNAEIQRD